MKLIIDVPYEAYYAFKLELGKGTLNALGEIIANGTSYEERPAGELIQSLTELCNRYCENCPITTNIPNECTDCICTHIRGIMKGGAE